MNPPPASPMTFSTGTGTFSKATSQAKSDNINEKYTNATVMGMTKIMPLVLTRPLIKQNKMDGAGGTTNIADQGQ